MNVRADSADAQFSDAAQYVFHISSGAGYGADAWENTAVMCTFAADGAVSCWADGFCQEQPDCRREDVECMGSSFVCSDTGQCVNESTGRCYRVGGDYVTGDASSTDGLMSASGKIKVFAGLRKDPFFFSFEGFTAVVGAVKAAAGSLMFNDAGCPTLDEATATSLTTLLTTVDGMQRPDTFAAANVLSLAIQVDTDLINSGGGTLAVWGSTRRAAE